MVHLAYVCVFGTLALSEAHKTAAFFDQITGRPPAKDFGARRKAYDEAKAKQEQEYEYEYYDEDSAVRKMRPLSSSSAKQHCVLE
jgi:hypothetical protein